MYLLNYTKSGTQIDQELLQAHNFEIKACNPNVFIVNMIHTFTCMAPCKKYHQLI